MRLYLIDSSAWSRMRTVPSLRHLKDRYVQPSRLVTCTPNLMELAFSADNASPLVYDRFIQLMRRAATSIPDLDGAPKEERAYGAQAEAIQYALFHAGQGRSAKVFDIFIAAYAILGSHPSLGREVAVLHYDQDFDRIAEVEPQLVHEWIAPRGSL